MKHVVIGGNGLIGTKLVTLLRGAGHDAISASRSTGVNVLTGEGLAAAMKGADVVVDVTNSPSFADAEVLRFFQTSTGHLLRAMADAGVKHFVVLSVVGADRVPDSGYLRAKAAQEALVEAASVPYTIVRATQFFEFLAAIADAAGSGDTARVPTALMQPIAGDDVAAEVCKVALSSPIRGMVEIAGPEALPMAECVRRALAAAGDPRTVIADPDARYFGAALNDRSLTPGDHPRLVATRLDSWLREQSGKEAHG